MTDELEWRLHAMLNGRAEQVDPALTGAELRQRADAAPRPVGRTHHPRRAAAMLAAAAVVAGLAFAVANYDDGNGGHRPSGPVPGGGVSAPAQTDPAPSPSPSPSPTPRTSTTPSPSSTADPRARPRPGVTPAPGRSLPVVEPVGSGTRRVSIVVLPSSAAIDAPTTRYVPTAPASTRPTR